MVQTAVLSFGTAHKDDKDGSQTLALPQSGSHAHVHMSPGEEIEERGTGESQAVSAELTPPPTARQPYPNVICFAQSAHSNGAFWGPGAQGGVGGGFFFWLFLRTAWAPHLIEARCSWMFNGWQVSLYLSPFHEPWGSAC